MKIFLLALILFSVPKPIFASRAIIKTHEVLVKKGEIHQGIQFPEGTRLNIVDDTNAVISGVLSQDFQMSGYLIKSGTEFQIWDNGKLSEIVTQAGQRLSYLSFDKGEARISFSKDSKIEEVYLTRPKKIGEYSFSEIGPISFFPDGRVSKGTLSQDQLLEGLNLKAKSEIQFYPSGRIKQAMLGKDSQFSGMSLKAGLTEFWSSGSVKTASLASHAKVREFICGVGPISFYESGRLKTFVVAGNQSVKIEAYEGQAPVEKAVKPGDHLNLNEAGKIIGWSGI